MPEDIVSAADGLPLRPGATVSQAWAAVFEGIDLGLLGVDLDATLAWAVTVGRRSGQLSIGDAWELLASGARVDVAAARILEPHLDALAILRQARDDGVLAPGDLADAQEHGTWGVFAAEGAGMRLAATPTGEGWILEGTKPWCSLAATLTHALVTAHVDQGGRRLFAVDLRAPGVHAHTGPWVARGLPGVVSAPVDFAGVPAVPVGAPGWYLERPGFAWGAVGVAAAWWGGATGLLEPLRAAAAREGADQVAAVHLGRADAALWGAQAALYAASVIAAHPASAADARITAARTRAVVADAVTRVLGEVDAALGPLPLVVDEDHARRVADLHLYVRQDHGLRDLARLGRMSAGTA